MGGTAKKVGKAVKNSFSSKVYNPLEIIQDPLGNIPLKWNDTGKTESARDWSAGKFPESTTTPTTPTYKSPIKSPQSALALEERLRSSRRKNVDPNVEFKFNLEKGGK